MAVDPNAPPEFQALGRVLQRVMAGEQNAALSSLPGERAEAVRRAVHEQGRE